MAIKNDATFEEKQTLGSKNDISNLVNFIASYGKSKYLCYIYVLLLLKVYYV